MCVCVCGGGGDRYILCAMKFVCSIHAGDLNGDNEKVSASDRWFLVPRPSRAWERG